MKFKKIARVLGCLESYECKVCACTITIHLIEPKLEKCDENLWYFVISKDCSIYAFNSSLAGIMLKSKDACIASAKNKLNEIIKSGFSNKENNVYYKLFESG